MRRMMLKSKIHRATVTAASIDYEGSITISRELMDAAGILEHEQVHVLDVNNGSRLVTYAISGETGEICINGAAARMVDVGDTVIILSYGEFTAEECASHRPVVVAVDEKNYIISPSPEGKMQKDGVPCDIGAPSLALPLQERGNISAETSETKVNHGRQ